MARSRRGRSLEAGQSSYCLKDGSGRPVALPYIRDMLLDHAPKIERRATATTITTIAANSLRRCDGRKALNGGRGLKLVRVARRRAAPATRS
jgi:hypothetical protein